MRPLLSQLKASVACLRSICCLQHVEADERLLHFKRRAPLLSLPNSSAENDRQQLIAIAATPSVVATARVCDLPRRAGPGLLQYDLLALSKAWP